MPQGVHAKKQTGFRFDPELLARLEDGAKRHGETMTDIVARGTAAELDRLDGITTSTEPPVPVSPPSKRARKPRADTAPRATFTAPLDSPDARTAVGADTDCPHPKARINKGLCGACGTYAGIKTGGK